MSGGRSIWRLGLEAGWELFRYDLLHRVCGFRGVYASCGRPVSCKVRADSELETRIPRVVAGACSFYWKRVLCLQRAIVTARILRRHGVAAEVVIGCRNAPFTGHAWVEVGGRVVNDSRGYRQKLAVLERF